MTDQTAPVITLNGASTITVAQGSTFTDPGITITDNVDTGLTATVTGTVDVNTVGTYTLSYDVTDAAGNAATTITRTIIVTAATATGGGSTGDTTTDPYSGNSGVLPSCTSPIQTSAQGFGLIPMLMTLLAGLGLVRRRKDN